MIIFRKALQVIYLPLESQMNIDLGAKFQRLEDDDPHEQRVSQLVEAFGNRLDEKELEDLFASIAKENEKRDMTLAVLKHRKDHPEDNLFYQEKDFQNENHFRQWKEEE